MKTLNIMVCIWLTLAAGSVAQEKAPLSEENGALTAALTGNRLLKNKAEALAVQMNGPLRVKGLFDRTFYKSASLEKTVELLSRICREYGQISLVRFKSSDSPDSAHFIFETEKGVQLPVLLTVNGETGLISGMFFTTPSRRNVPLASVKEQFAALPGRTGFLAVKLNAPGAILEALNPDEAFAIASVSRLYLLGAAQRKGYSWKKVLTVKESAKSLPPGRMRNWPDGAPATVYTLALGMISENDNTAADALADSLGRGTIERLLPELGHSAPGLTTPFLKTSDVFRLRSDTTTALKYANASTPERYMMLDKISREPLSSGAYNPGPFAMDRIGWHASPADLCRLMEYFRKNKDGAARKIMAAAPGLDAPRNKFAYAGYKGGQEPGVLSAVWLLEKNNEDWYCLTGSWNNGLIGPDEKKFNELLQLAIYAIGGQE